MCGLNVFDKKIIFSLAILLQHLIHIAMYKVQIVSVLASDNKSLTEMQKKINQWITVGLIKKYELHTTATHVIFNICLKKEA